MRIRSGVLVLVAWSLVAGPVRAEDLESLRAENRRLRERVEQLEAENARLERDGAAPLVAALEAKAESEIRRDGDVLSTEPLAIETTSGPRSRHWLWLQARGTAPDAVELVVDAIVSGGAYRDARTLALDVDGTLEDLAILRRTTTSRAPTRGTAGAGASGETVTAAVPRMTLARLAQAKAVDAKLGPTAFRLTPEHLAAIRAFDARIAPPR